jgi:branched-chain amino acid transport system substrate-binding protein
MIAPSTTSPSLTSDLQGNAGSNYHPGYYRTSNNDLYQAQVVARFAYDELGLRRMAAIHDGDPYTTGLTGAFTTAFEEMGGSVFTASVSRGDTYMVSVLTQIAEDNPDGLFFPLFPDEGAYIVRQIGQIPGLEDVTLIGGAALLVSEFMAIPESEGIYFPGPELDFGSNVNEATGKSGDELIAAYREQYGEAPTSAYLAHAYDAATILLRAIEEVAVAEGDTLYIDRARLREALTATIGFNGIIGVISCDEFGDCGTGRVHISHHTDSSVTDAAELPVVYRFAP